jgi:spermidine synthase
MPVLFGVTLFASATLLFLVEPMIAKMILPKLGGTPAVWNTCMVFFQAALLAGYGYAHASTAWLGVRRQALLHAGLLFLPLAVLPIAVSDAWTPPADANPVLAVLGLLAVAVGLTFFVISASAPLLQKWFAGTGHASARDPYFLYAASNLGSMIGLIAYPAVIERYLSLRTQSQLWTRGYLIYALLTALCAFVLWRSPALDEKAQAVETPRGADAAPLTIWSRLHWIILAFVPSSLMLGATTYMSTDIAAIPLIWVMPLALYLLSFILVFSRLPQFVHTLMVLVLPVLVLLQLFLKYAGMTRQIPVLFGIHLLTLFAAAMVCHGELARRRPAPRHLTEYYLWMSFGGVLGGLFNALVAPMIFTTVVEYPLVMMLACLLMPRIDESTGFVARTFDRFLAWFVDRQVVQDWRKRQVTPRVLDFWLPILLGLFTFGLLFRVSSPAGTEAVTWLQGHLRRLEYWLGAGDHFSDYTRFAAGVQFGVPVLLCYLFVSRPIRFGLGVGAVMLAGALYSARTDDDVIYRDRSFFGVLKLETEQVGDVTYHRLIHGTTAHGMQRVDADGKPVHNCEPLTYYHRTGPIGQLFAALQKENQNRPLAFIGLGTGTLASYGAPGQEVTYYEIDAAVERIALNPNYFSYYQDAKDRGVHLNIVKGDARLSLRDKAPDGHYRLIIVDAFSSDAIPVHLITKEALRLYRDKLAPDGIVAFHISNRYLDLRPVLANLAEDAGMAAIIQHDDSEKEVGKYATEWVLLAGREADFGALADDIKQKPEDEDRHWTRLRDDLAGDDTVDTRPSASGRMTSRTSSVFSCGSKASSRTSASPRALKSASPVTASRSARRWCPNPKKASSTPVPCHLSHG